MRKYGITFLALLLCLYVKGQTNTFPSSGNVGIGIINPTQKLHIHNGNLLISNGNQTIQSELHSSDYSRFMFNGNQNFIISYGTNHAEAYKLALKANNTSGKIALWTNSAERFVLDQNGNVGIGLASPSSKLDIAGYGNGVSLLKLSTERPWEFIQMGSAPAAFLALRSTVDNKQFIIQSPLGIRNSIFGVSDTPENNKVFFLTEGGKMGIGTTNLIERVNVNGTIRASEVRVENVPQSDYVFEPDYPLLPLSEVEAHIKERKHLPGIPSAEQFKENGVGLGEMDDMLLRKVEEIMLYVIQQQRELEELKIINEIQSEENTVLKNELMKLKHIVENEN